MALFLKDTIGHRYFLVFQMLVILFSLFHLQTFKPLYKYIWLCVFGLSLLFSNWLYYPGKTLGDATLAYRNYFKIEEQIQQQFGDTMDIYSYAPVANPPELKYLKPNGMNIHRITEDDLSNYAVIYQSNVNAEFTQEQLAQLQQWHGTSFERGAVYVNIFFNPAYYPPNSDWKLREEGKFEKWMKEMKK